MELYERIELRRFVGREWLLWLWFETEVFEATLSTKAHGQFGLWLEGRLVMSAGQEATAIKGTQPGNHREAKESLLRGKLPDAASLHLSWADHEATFTIKAEKMALSGLKLPGKKKEAGGEAPGAVASLTSINGPAPPPRAKRKKSSPADEAAAFEAHEAHEAFYDRMTVTREIESIVEALYRDFLALRLGPAWGETVVPALEAWATGDDVDDAAYRKARTRAIGGGAAKRASSDASLTT